MYQYINKLFVHSTICRNLLFKLEAPICFEGEGALNVVLFILLKAIACID